MKKFTGNFIQAANLLFDSGFAIASYSPNSSLEQSKAQIKKDIPRSVFVGSPQQSRESFNERLANVTTLYYVQGQADGGALSFALKTALESQFSQDTSFNPTEQERAEERRREQLLQTRVDLRFAYIDDNNELSAFSISYCEATQQWICVIIHGTDKAPEHRTVTLYFSDNSLPLFPKIDSKSLATVKESEVIGDMQTALNSEFINPLIKKIHEGAILPNSLRLLVHSLDKNDNNADLIKAMGADQPIQLSPSAVMTANLSILLQKGFEITPHVTNIRYQAQVVETDTSNNADDDGDWQRMKTSIEVVKEDRNTYFVCEKNFTKLVLFAPSTDSISHYEKYHHLLHTQEIAKPYIEQGYTCVIPVVEMGDFKLDHFTVSSRNHHVLLMWSKDELKFFDPKSGKEGWVPMITGSGYDNMVFKEFGRRAGYTLKLSYLNRLFTVDTYPDIKETYIEGTFNPNDCGYYCVERFRVFVDHLLTPGVKTPIAQSGEAFNQQMTATGNALSDAQKAISLRISHSGLPPWFFHLLQNTYEAGQIFAIERAKQSESTVELVVNTGLPGEELFYIKADVASYELGDFKLDKKGPAEGFKKPASVALMEENAKLAPSVNLFNSELEMNEFTKLSNPIIESNMPTSEV